MEVLSRPTTMVVGTGTMNQLLVKIQINGQKVTALLDTGSLLTLIHPRLINQHTEVKTAPVLATSVTGHSLPIIGTALVPIQLGKKIVTQEVHINEENPYACIVG